MAGRTLKWYAKNFTTPPTTQEEFQKTIFTLTERNDVWGFWKFFLKNPEYFPLLHSFNYRLKEENPFPNNDTYQRSNGALNWLSETTGKGISDFYMHRHEFEKAQKAKGIVTIIDRGYHANWIKVEGRNIHIKPF